MGIGTFVFLGRISNFIHESTANYSDYVFDFYCQYDFWAIWFHYDRRRQFPRIWTCGGNIAGLSLSI